MDISVPHNLPITAVDLYVLLGNTLDNAIEACEYLLEPSRYIHLQIRTFHDILSFQIENPYSKDYTNRIRGKNNGFGLKNVEKCVKKHEGDMSITRKDGIYTLYMRVKIGGQINTIPPNNAFAKEHY